MPFGFTTEEFLGGADAVEAVKAARSSYSLLDDLAETAKQIIPKAVSSAQAAMAQLSYSGTTGNFLSTEETITLTGKFYRTVDQFPEKIGSTLHQAVLINSLSGFAQCRNAVFSSSTATTEEELAIEAFMNNGFFYE